MDRDMKVKYYPILKINHPILNKYVFKHIEILSYYMPGKIKGEPFKIFVNSLYDYNLQNMKSKLKSNILFCPNCLKSDYFIVNLRLNKSFWIIIR